MSDAVAIAEAVRNGRVRATDVVDDALARAETDTCNAVVTICYDEARRDAARIDDGDNNGSLAGVPFTVKDTIATAGVRTTAGSLLFADHVPDHDAPVVARLRAAGAVLIGKTNCPEFALQPRTDNRVFGPTRHPADPQLSPGGSSGGCAAAVAGGVVPFSIGGDYGGSIRYPATITGLYGFRPALGMIDASGTLPAPPAGSPRAVFQTVGPLARTLDDLALVLEVLGVDTTAPETVTSAPLDPELLARASACFDDWRATDDYADLRALAAGREDLLTDHIARLITGASLTGSTPPISDARQELADALALTPVLTAPVALDGTPRSIDAAEDSLAFLAPSRGISLLGVAALAVPGNVQYVGAPGAILKYARRGPTIP